MIDFAATRAELEHDEGMAAKEDGKRKPGTAQCSRSVSDVSPNIYKNLVLPSSEEIEGNISIYFSVSVLNEMHRFT